MKDPLKEFSIKFVGLELGEHEFNFKLNDLFFELFNYSEFNNSSLEAKLILNKLPNRMELGINIKGIVELQCDLSNLPFTFNLDSDLSLVVKFGEEYNDEDDALLILPNSEFELNVAQYLYEATALAVPYKRINPDLENSEEGKKMLEVLEKYSPVIEEEKESIEDVDPRWNKLKDLLK